MKILFLANHFDTLYNFRRELIEKLVALDHEVIISIPDDEKNYFRNLGCRVIITRIERRGINPIKDFLLILSYKKIISDIEPDFIFSYTIKPNIYGSLANTSKALQVCNITGTGATFLRNNITSKICKILYRLSMRNVYKIFFQNKNDMEFFENNKMINDNYEVIPGSGCNLSENQFYPMKNTDILKFIFIGRIMTVKGINEYLEMAKFIKSNYSNIEFYVAGWIEEDKWKAIIEEYDKNNIIHYIGFTKEIKKWIRECHCTVLASYGGEGTPNVILESEATGRPCIGSRIGGIKEAILDNQTGFLFAPKNTNDLINKVEKYIQMNSTDRQNMGERARKFIEKNYDRNIVIGKYLALITNH